MPDENEMGWCQQASAIFQATRRECAEVSGVWTKEEPGDCVIVSATVGENDLLVRYLRNLRDCIIAEDPTAKQLWVDHRQQYYDFGAPIADALLEDETLRQLLITFVIHPVLHFLNTTSMTMDPSNDDRDFKQAAVGGVRAFRENLEKLGGDRGTELAEAVLSCLRTTQGDVE